MGPLLCHDHFFPSSSLPCFPFFFPLFRSLLSFPFLSFVSPSFFFSFPSLASYRLLPLTFGTETLTAQSTTQLALLRSFKVCTVPVRRSCRAVCSINDLQYFARPSQYFVTSVELKVRSVEVMETYFNVIADRYSYSAYSAPFDNGIAAVRYRHPHRIRLFRIGLLKKAVRTVLRFPYRISRVYVTDSTGLIMK
jgi:hypothetical protein